jgi:glyoxylase-like metal-dependent hydrolase (beta-lactamase superfamily II)
MKIICIPSRPMGINTYVVYNENNDALIVDPGFETDKIISKIEGNGLTVTDILLTHGHFDHIYNIPLLTGREQSPRPTVRAHIHEKQVITDSDANGSREFCEQPFTAHPDAYFEEGPHIFGGMEITVIHTPGHTAGSCCFLINRETPYLITGDTIMRGGIGRSDFATGNHAQLIDSIKNKILSLPDETVLLPGHGGKTTVLHEKGNPYIC